MYFPLQKLSDCSVKICNIWEEDGSIRIPSEITDAILVNNVDIELTNFCEEEDAIIEEQILPLPLGLTLELECEDVTFPQYSVTKNIITGPGIPVGSEYNWYFYYNNSLINSFINVENPVWSMLFEIDRFVLELKLPNGLMMIYTYVVTSSVLNVDGCYDYTFNNLDIEYEHDNYTIDENMCMVFDVQPDGVYNYSNNVDYNTSLLNNQEAELDSCFILLCSTKCKVAKYSAQNLCSELQLMFYSLELTDECNRCEDACTLLEYINTKLNNEEDCNCYGNDCC